MNIKYIEESAYKVLGKGYLGLVKKTKAKSAIKSAIENAGEIFGKEKENIIESFNLKLGEKDSFISSQEKVSQRLKENVDYARLGLRYLNKLLKSQIKLGDASVVDYRKSNSCEYIKIKQMELCDTNKTDSFINNLLSLLEANSDKNVIKIEDKKTRNIKYQIFPSYDTETKNLKHVSIYKLNPNKKGQIYTSEYHISFQNNKVKDATYILGSPSDYTLFKDLDSNMRTKLVSYREKNEEYAQIEYV